MGNYKDFICQLIGIFILIADVLIIKEYVYYLFGLIKVIYFNKLLRYKKIMNLS